MADQFDSVQALERELNAARQAFDHAHFSSLAHQEQVVRTAQQLIPAAAAACAAQGAGAVATQLLQDQLLHHVGNAAGVSWAEVIHLALGELGQTNNVTGYVPGLDAYGSTPVVPSTDTLGPYGSHDDEVVGFAAPGNPFATPAGADSQQMPGYIPGESGAGASPWVPVGGTEKQVGTNKASNKNNAVILAVIGLVAVLILGGATYGIVTLLDNAKSPNSANSSNGSPSKTDPATGGDPTQNAGPPPAGTGPAIPQDAAGDVAMWGTPLYLDNATTQPILPGNPDYYAPSWVPALADVQSIALAYSTGYAVMDDGTVKSWGANTNGLLGVSAPDSDRSLVQVEGLSEVAQVFSRGETTYALLKDGTVTSWGLNDEGQLGDGSDVRFSPVPVAVKGLAGVKDLALAEFTTYALMEDGTVMAWGANDKGQLGSGINTYRSNVPVQVTGLAGVTSVATGPDSAFAVLADGTVMGWGESFFTDPSGTKNYAQFYEVPIVVEGFDNVRKVVSGRGTLFAIRNDGTVQVVGSREYGATGDGTDEWDFAQTQLVPDLANVADLIVGRKVVFALRNDGTVISWGTNDYGLLGQGSKNEDEIMVPKVIEGLTGVNSIAVSYDTAHATLVDGTVMSWGRKSAMTSNTKSYDQLVTSPEDVSGLSGVRTFYASETGFYAIVPKN